MSKLTGNHLPGSEEEKARLKAHAEWSEKLADDMVRGLNEFADAHPPPFPDIDPNVPVDPKVLAKVIAELEAEEGPQEPD